MGLAREVLNLLERKKFETGLIVTGKTTSDIQKLQKFIKDSDFYAEFDNNVFVFPEEEENYDELEKELTKQFNKLGIHVSFEGIFN